MFAMDQWCFSIVFIVSILSFTSAEFSLTILHNNDMHARFEQTNQMSSKCSEKDAGNNKCFGGFARVAYAVKEAKRLERSGTGPPVIFLNAGDTYQGTVWFTVHKWKIVAKLTSMLGIDASVWFTKVLLITGGTRNKHTSPFKIGGNIRIFRRRLDGPKFVIYDYTYWVWS
jgi:hypothetical protein